MADTNVSEEQYSLYLQTCILVPVALNISKLKVLAIYELMNLKVMFEVPTAAIFKMAGDGGSKYLWNVGKFLPDHMTNRDKIIICDRRVVFNLWLAGWNGREG
jgi:hypothetical protein